jgi:hypothetical protein
MLLSNLKELVRGLVYPTALRLLAGGIALFALATATTLLAARAPDNGSSLSDGPRVSAPRGMRIKVQVLNGTKTSGLAAKATRYLRDRGFDVVEAGTSSTPAERTQILDRSGKHEAARLVALALSVPRAEAIRDTSRYVDVTVILGPDWSPPAGPFGT